MPKEHIDVNHVIMQNFKCVYVRTCHLSVSYIENKVHANNFFRLKQVIYYFGIFAKYTYSNMISFFDYLSCIIIIFDGTNALCLDYILGIVQLFNKLYQVFILQSLFPFLSVMKSRGKTMTLYVLKLNFIKISIAMSIKLY